MTNPNSYPSQPDQLPEPITVQYEDGAMALKYDMPGVTLVLEAEDAPTFATSFHGRSGANMALVKTRTGNVYGLAKGLIVNFNQRTGYPMPSKLPAVTVGKPWFYDTDSYTTEVESVTFRYKSANPGYPTAQQVNGPDPFKILENNIDILIAQDPSLNPDLAQ